MRLRVALLACLVAALASPVLQARDSAAPPLPARSCQLRVMPCGSPLLASAYRLITPAPRPKPVKPTTSAWSRIMRRRVRSVVPMALKTPKWRRLSRVKL